MSRHQLFRDGVLVYDYSDGSSSAPPNQGGAVPPITTKPGVAAVLPENGEMIVEQVSPYQVVGYQITTRDGVRARTLDVVTGGGGPWFDHVSWAIFDSGGMRVMGGDDVAVGGGGLALDTPTLMPLGAGIYVFAVAVNSLTGQAGQTGTRFNQR